MKIAIIAPTEIPARRANTLQVMKMAQAMAALGHTVRLAVPGSASVVDRGKSPDAQGNRPADNQHSWEELAHHYGLQHAFAVDWLFSHPRLRRYDFSWRALRWASGWQADLVYTRLPQAAALSSQRGMATILEVHDLPQGIAGPWLFRRFLHGKGARKLVVITRALATDLSRRFGMQLSEPFTVIAADGVDLERYERLPQPAEARLSLLAQIRVDASSPLSRLSPERFTLGYTGHLYPGRGRELLLELAKRLPQVAFLVVGGEARDIQAFQAEIQARQVENLILTGFVPNAELPLYQAACDVLLMPYQQKVAASSGGDIARYLSPMKLFEYLACQRPIVSSDLAVLQEVLNPQNAILAPTDDLDSWERAITSLQTNPELRDGLASQARQDAQRYTWEMRARQILEGLGRPEEKV
jgi:glycosyltransferase involved in cell wall biosynthesis